MKNPLPYAALITLLTVALTLWLERPHPVVPQSAPMTEYSGERAMALLNRFLAENSPHAVGSEQNREIKYRIQAWLDAQGIEHEEQQGWGCTAKWQSCAYVENIIATIPGELEGPYVAMMAHYDSVPNAVGAGDDMAGVVAVLETARAAQEVGNFRHPIMLIITDGEETGLHGAAAFFDRHPLAASIGVLLNVEGSGTRGASMVLRTSMANAWYMNLFAANASQPMGSSLANEVFKRMPNDTDFSVSMAADIPGIDFSFAGERNHYHTPNDNPENLDPRTVQHHGDNLFPLVLELANANLSAQHEGDVAYLNSSGIWLQWPVEWNPVIFLLAGVLLFLASLQARVGIIKRTVAATVIPLSLLLAGGLLVQLCMALLSAIDGANVAWPAHQWPRRLVMVFSMLLPALLVGRWLAQRMSLETLLVGGWSGLWLLTLPLLLIMPDAAAVFLPQLLLASTMLALASRVSGPSAMQAGLRLGTVAAAALFLIPALLMEQTQGYGLVVTIWPWIGFFTICSLGFYRGPALLPAVVVSAASLLVGLVAAIALPIYSEYRPQHVNILYLEDTDASTAIFHLETEGDAPATMLDASNFSPEPTQVVPWSEAPVPYAAPVTTARLPAPTLDVENSHKLAIGREVTLRLSSRRNAWRIRLYLPESAELRGATVDGAPMPLPGGKSGESQQYTGLLFYGTQNRDALVTLTLGSSDPVTGFLADTSSRMPEVARKLVSARPVNASPVHGGDRSTVFRQVDF